MAVTDENKTLSLHQIFRTWWPLAASWLIMTGEIPALAAVVARKAQPEVHLAAWGVVFPLALILASPITMLLAASTTLSKDWASYTTLRRYMFVLAGALTAFHVLLAFTPLFYLLVEDVMAAPAEIIEPVRLGLRIMLPWSFALAYRRFNYGVLIRFGHPGAVTVGSGVRLLCDALAGSVLYFMFDLPGIAVATGTIIAGVLGEALYARLRIAPVQREQVRPAPPVAEPVTLRMFALFYVPLVMTSLLQILVQPIGTAALSRMPDPLTSLAVWPVVYGLLIFLMSTGIAFTEVVVIMLEEPRASGALQRFATLLAVTLSGILLLIAATPLADVWFGRIVALPADLVAMAHQAVWFCLLVPGLAAFESFFNGILLNRKRTRGITEGVFLGLLTMTVVLVAGITTGAMTGVNVAALALTVGASTRVAWLWYRSRPARRAFRMQDVQLAA